MAESNAPPRLVSPGRPGKNRTRKWQTSFLRGGAPRVEESFFPLPVYDVAAAVSAGIPIEEILSDYPTLDREKVELAAIFAEANPPRGRPRARGELPKGSVIISDRRTPRRKKA